LSAPLVEANPDVSEVHLYDPRGRHRSWTRRIALGWTLRRRGFDVAFAFRTSADAHLLAAMSGARYRVGYAEKPLGRLLTHRLLGGHWRGAFHEVDRNLRLLDAIRIPAATRRTCIRLTPDEREWARDWLDAHRLRDELLLGVHVGASTPDRQYPAERMAHAASVLAAELGSRSRVVVFGGPADEAPLRGLLAALAVQGEAAWPLSLRQMAALFSQCALLLVNDSGPMHVGAALDVPLVALFGPGDHVRWMPENATARLVRPDRSRPGTLPSRPGQSSVHEVPVEWVIEAGRSLLVGACDCAARQ
jgi:heptosyltransferase-2